MVLMDVAGAPAACGDVSCAHGALQVHGSIPSVAPLLPRCGLSAGVASCLSSVLLFVEIKF